MPKDTSSPFTPGISVPVEFFVGRIKEVERLRKKVASAAIDGHLEVGFLTGERGIGKSSLASLVRYLSEKDHQMIGLHTFLGGVISLEEMVRRVFDRLLKESVETSWHEKMKDFFGSKIRQVGLFGISVEFEASTQDLKRMVHDFAPALRNLIDRLKDEKKGIFIILDDINGLASSPDFSNWLKSLVDEIATSQKPLPLYLLLVGIEERRQELIRSQPSLARVFDLVEIRA
jgi:AAA+ ATPase superfamily predicted ATPase